MTASSKLNVLFVDDDPLILQGLQRMLRPLRNEWDMAFVDSGARALEAMASSPFQVIVSDMRMPGMNGAQLLLEIKNRYPKTVRLILSGHADKDLIMQCVGTAHQFLAKPCEPEAIRGAISRASAFDNSIKSEKIKSLIAQMDKLPSIPSIYSDIVEKLRHDECSLDEIGELISKDLAITAKLLKLVNSAFFGLRRQVSNPSEAVAYLGIETMKALVLSVNAFDSIEISKRASLSLEKLWMHSLEVAMASKRIMESEPVPRIFADESFVAGLLHDLGKLVLCVNVPAEHETALQLSTSENIPLYQAEERIFGANHADIGGYILNLWGLPPGVVEAIRYHHDPEAAVVTGLTPLVAVHVGNSAVHTSYNDTSSSLRTEFLTSLGFGPKLQHWTHLEIC